MCYNRQRSATSDPALYRSINIFLLSNSNSQNSLLPRDLTVLTPRMMLDGLKLPMLDIIW